MANIFVCEHHGTCCNYKYCNSREELTEEGKECEYLTEYTPMLRAKWKRNCTIGKEWECSICFHTTDVITDYCSGCGAEMTLDRREI